MKIFVSKAFTKWQNSNKSNKPLLEVIDRFLFQVHNATNIANVTPQPKAAGKNLRKATGTVDEFTLNKSYRIYSKCVETEPGTVCFYLAVVGAKGSTNQNDDILMALNMFDNIANETWSTWQPSAEQLKAAALANVSADESVASDDTKAESTSKQKKKKGKPLDENGLTVAERKAQRKQQQAEEKRRAEAAKQRKNKENSASSLSAVQITATQNVTHTEQQHDSMDDMDEYIPDELAAVKKAVTSAVAALNVAEEADKFATEILNSDVPAAARKKAKEATKAAQEARAAYKRAINAAGAADRTNDWDAMVRASMVAVGAAETVKRKATQARNAVTQAQSIVSENGTAVSAASIVGGRSDSETSSRNKELVDRTKDNLVALQDADGAEKENATPTTTDVVDDPDVPGVPDVMDVADAAADAATADIVANTDDDISDDEIRVVRPQNMDTTVTVNDMSVSKPEPITGDVKFDSVMDIQYELALIEHNINIERSRIVIAEQRIAMEKSKIAMEEMEIKKLQLLCAQKMQNMQK